MHTLVASAVYVSLAAGIFAQQSNGVKPANGEDPAARTADTNRQVQLVNSYRHAGDYAAAERVLREWLASEPAGSDLHPTVQNSLAHLLREEGRHPEARQLFTQIVNSADVMWQQRLSALIGLADLDEHLLNWKASTQEWNSALDITRSQKDTASEAVALRGLGHAWFRAGSMARAEPLLRRSLRMVENDAQTPPLDVATALSAMAEYYQAANKLVLAEDAWSRALAIERAELGEGHPQTAVLMQMLASVYSERGETDLAFDYATRASETLRQWFGEGSPITATALANLALVEQRAHTPGAAARHYETAVRVLRRFPELGPTLRIVMQRYAGLLKSMHRDREAKALDMEVKAFRSN